VFGKERRGCRKIKRRKKKGKKDIKTKKCEKN